MNVLKKKLRLGSKVFRMKLKFLFDSVFHQETKVGVRHWETVTHKYLLFGFLRCKIETDTVFTFNLDSTQNSLVSLNFTELLRCV